MYCSNHLLEDYVFNHYNYLEFMKMYEEIFGKSPRVKLINYILINPDLEYTKKQLALGSGIARSTLDSIITDIMNEGYLLKTNNKYHLNKNSEYVKVLYETQIKLANIGAKELSKKDNPKKRLSDEELDMIFDEESDFDIDEQLEKLEYEEEKIRIVSFINNKKKVMDYAYIGK